MSKRKGDATVQSAPSRVNGAEQGPAAEWVDPKTLIPWAKNPRVNDAAVGPVAASISRFGFGAPIVARRADRKIIAGHTRWLAAKKLNLQSVPVRYMDVSDDDARKLALADNKLGEISDWNEDVLAEVLREMSVDDAALVGWSGDDLERLLHDTTDDAIVQAQLGAGLTYQVIVATAGEQQQAELMKRLEDEGFKCKPLIS